MIYIYKNNLKFEYKTLLVVFRYWFTLQRKIDSNYALAAGDTHNHSIQYRNTIQYNNT